ncbi:dTDP-4-dehydrorhamnose reductase [Vibrio mediterranei]|uniref:dTDP-4-dehydrorhamnose reductase n=1 Tax=Vibrio mediterranei TaxID=689 RepID=A0ABX5DGA8_9VIBR|nr:dTDP-4-dehydrorhamnose reductase [Vibrio mediterranei]PCD87702.1 dTDP-4-dehydrorhamnose reductase [Vibrio mediterranei]PRQ67326.1 dTDP-4-dehydrorhamnose reductase [Vibrio mediterranei]
MKRVLITGSYGQVGHCLTNVLSVRDDIDVIAYDREVLDIISEAQVASVLAELTPDVIINCAAHTAVDKAETDVEMSYAINCDGPRHLAQAAESLGAVMLHISTDYVFDGEKDEPYLETDTPNPKGVYGQSKLAGEQAVAAHCTRYAILRTAWVFGEHGNNFVKTMLRLGQDRPELGIIGDQFGGPTYAGDIANALVAMMDGFNGSEQSGVYHFSGAPHVSWYQFAKAIFESADKHGVLPQTPQVNEITAAQYPLPAPRPANSRLNCDKIQQVFAVAPSDWQSALDNIGQYC